MRRHDALRPRILSLSVRDGEVLEPGPVEIVATLDRPVSDDGWSVVPVLPGGEPRFPRVASRTLDAAGTTFRVGLELEPGREYELQINTPHGHGLRSVSDGVPLAPRPIRFRTRAADTGTGQ